MNSLDLDHYPYYSESPKFSDNLKSYLICNKNYSIATLSTTILISKIITSRNLLLRILYQKVLYNTKLNFFRFKQKKKHLYNTRTHHYLFVCNFSPKDAGANYSPEWLISTVQKRGQWWQKNVIHQNDSSAMMCQLVMCFRLLTPNFDKSRIFSKNKNK